MNGSFEHKVINVTDIFDDYFLDNNRLFLYCFQCVPSIGISNSTNGEKAFDEVSGKFKDLIIHIHRYQTFNRYEKKYLFGKTIVVFKNKCLIAFSEGYCEILHDGKQHEFVNEISGMINQFRQKQRRIPLEINLIVQQRNNLELRSMEIKRTKLDLGLFYEDDFIRTDELIRKRLNKNNDKGIVLLHGLPGTGKTSYLRYLIGKIKKRVLFLSPSVAGDLMSPGFIEILINNPNSVLIIEDAENIIMDRTQNSGSAVSNLLNISDGLLADFLNVQLICTFNSSLTLIDSALMRKGRLIAKYEFGKLGVGKSQRLSEHLGFKTTINKPMTIAEIANQHETDVKAARKEVIGFRANLVDN